MCDTWVDWDDVAIGLESTVTIMVRQTLDDPASTSPPPTWTPWDRFVNGQYHARAWQFEAVLDAPTGQNIGIETLCITGDFASKADAGEDVPYTAIVTRVYFGVKFYQLPAVNVTLQLAMAEDRIEIVAKTTTYFEITVTTRIAAPTTTTAAFTQPAVNGTVVVPVASAAGLAVNQKISIGSAGLYKITAVAGLNITVQNTGAIGNAAPASVIPTAQSFTIVDNPVGNRSFDWHARGY
jgi:hypothetical protein